MVLTSTLSVTGVATQLAAIHLQQTQGPAMAEHKSVDWGMRRRWRSARSKRRRMDAYDNDRPATTAANHQKDQLRVGRCFSGFQRVPLARLRPTSDCLRSHFDHHGFRCLRNLVALAGRELDLPAAGRPSLHRHLLHDGRELGLISNSEYLR